MGDAMRRILKILSAYSGPDSGRRKGRIVQRGEPPHFEERFTIPGFKDEEHKLVPFSRWVPEYV